MEVHCSSRDKEIAKQSISTFQVWWPQAGGRKSGGIGEALTLEFKAYGQVAKNKAMEAVFKKKNICLLCGGTDNHLLLADVYGSLGITGQEAETVLDEVGITLNKNMIADELNGARSVRNH